VAGGFVFAFPVWIIVDQAAMQKRGLPDAMKLATYSDQGTVFPIFTEELFAERFVRDASLKGVTEHRLELPSELITLGEVANSAKVKSAAIDIQTRGTQHKFLMPIEEMLRYLRALEEVHWRLEAAMGRIAATLDRDLQDRVRSPRCWPDLGHGCSATDR
jgi:hypothetical protein